MADVVQRQSKGPGWPGLYFPRRRLHRQALICKAYNVPSLIYNSSPCCIKSLA